MTTSIIAQVVAVPTLSAPEGSIAQRSDGANGEVYVRHNSAWVALLRAGAIAVASITAGTNGQVIVTAGGVSTWATIVDANISASAAIAVTKLAAGTDGQVLTTASSTPTWATIVDANISSSAAITLSKLGQGGASTGQALLWSGAAWAPSTNFGAQNLVTTGTFGAGATTVTSLTDSGLGLGVVHSSAGGAFTSSLIVNADITAATITLSKLAQDGATSAQVIAWNGSEWAPATVTSSGGTITDVVAGAGLTGGGSSGAVTLDVVAADGTITVNANSIQVGTVPWAQLSGTPTTIAGYGITNGALNTLTLTAGAGLTGGGTLAADRTFNIVAADGTITVNADSIQVGTVPWAQISGTPTTLAGYGITNGTPSTRTITTTAPLTIDATTSADLSANRTLAISDATTSALGAIKLAGDLGGTGLVPTVLKIKSTSISTAGGALTTGQVLRVISSATADWGALDLANASAVTGVLPVGNHPSLAGDVTGTITANTVVTLTGSSSIVAVAANELKFAIGATPKIWQTRQTSGDGVTFTIRAQDTDGDNGGDLSLGSGSGGDFNGAIIFNSGLDGEIARFTGGSGPGTFQFASAWTAPIIKQADASSANGKNFTIAAQAGNGTNKNGGNLVLMGGDSTGAGLRGGIKLCMDGDASADIQVELAGIATAQRVVALCKGAALAASDVPTGDRVAYLANCATIPSSDPVGGAVIFCTQGSTFIRSPDGFVTQIGVGLV